MRLIGKILFIWLLASNLAFADTEPITSVVIEPLDKNVTFTTVTVNTDEWVTIPTVAQRGRKEISILNTAISGNLYFTTQSGSTTTRHLFPRQEVTLKLSSEVNLFATGDSVQIQIMEIR